MAFSRGELTHQLDLDKGDLQCELDYQERINNHADRPTNTLLQGVVESLLDGILILTEKGDLMSLNNSAQEVCDRLTTNASTPNIPKEVWHVCQMLIESFKNYSSDTVVVEDEISTEKFPLLRIRARWVSLKTSEQPYILVLLEDRYLANQRLAIAESIQYCLTPRETEVWQLYRTDCPRKEIAKKLFISVSTVKKHIKNVLAKRRMFQNEGLYLA